MKHTLVISVIVLLSAFLAGCRSEDPLRHFVVADSPEMFNVVTPLSGRGTPSVVDGVRYDIAFDDVERIAVVTISNLRCAEHEEGVNAVFSDIEFTYGPGSHQKQRIIERDQMNSLTDPGAAVTLSDVTFVYTESNALNSIGASGFYAEFTVDGLYRVLAYPYVVYADGTTVVRKTGTAEGEAIDYDPVYTVRLNPDDKSADVDIRGLTLDGRKCDVTICGLVLKLLPDGYSLQKTDLTDVVFSSPEPVELVDFNANALLRDELNINMSIKIGDRQFAVEAFLSPDMCKKS